MRYYFGLIALLLAVASCEERQIDLAALETQERQNYLTQNNISVSPTASGLYFIPQTTTSGTAVQAGNPVRLLYSVWLTNGKRVFKAQTMYLVVGEGYYVGSRNVATGLEEALLGMRQGERARIIVPSALAYGNLSYGDITPYSTLIYEVEVVSANLKKDETDAINNYLTQVDPLLQYIEDEGIYFYKKTTVSDETLTLPEADDIVTVTYTGTFLTGNPFDRNLLGFQVTIGKGSVVAGFESAVKKLKVGESAKVLIPSEKAYGVQGSASILPYTPIIFELYRIE